MDRTVFDQSAALPQHVAPHRFATLIATVLMVAILAAMIVGIRGLAAGATPFLDDASALLFATG